MAAGSASRSAVAAILVAFALAGIARLNAACLLEPDSPEYLFGAKSLASLDGYREIDRPGEPPHTLRPPGLSILLAPLAWFAPYEIVPAKAVVLGLSLLALALLGALAARGATPWAAPAAVLAIASSPYTLLHATEVATEIPYLACATGAILLMTRSAGPPRRSGVAAAAILMGFLPFLRTVGLALVIATAVWIWLDRTRRAWWPAPATALAASLAWTIRNHLAAGPTYFGAIAADLRRLGGAGYFSKVAGACVFYAGRFLDVLLPGVWPGRPLYERMTIGGAPDLGGLHGAAWIAGVAIVALAVSGAWERRRQDGALIAIYASVFVGILAIYPPRHERLSWPLVPLAWALVPSGLQAAGRRLGGGRGATGALAGAALGLAALVAWQASASAAMAGDNLAWRRSGDAFYAERVPPIYFADWRQAGRWLQAHAPKDARVLTRHSDVGLTSGLAQDSVRFEELPPSAWRARIARAGARYLVVPTSLYGKFFPMELLPGDPAYTYTEVYGGRDVAVLEVSPNLRGVVAPPAPLGPRLDACAAAAAREPRRTDLSVRRAELLAATGKRDEAIADLDAIARRGGADVRVVVTLGELLLDAGRDREAGAAFALAAGLPEAELLEQRIERGRTAAGERLAAKGVDKHVRARIAAARAQALMEQLRWAEAFVAIDEANVFDPEDPLVLKTTAEWMLHVGRDEEAVAGFGASGGRGDPAARAAAVALRAALTAESRPESADAASCARAASFFAGEGMPGRALALLEKVAPRFPGDSEVGQRLTELRRFYGRTGGRPASF